MLDSLLLWCGAAALGGGLIVAIWRRRALIAAAIGVLMMIVALLLPVSEHRASTRTTRLDEAMPAWQFDEHHELHVDAPPTRVYEAIRDVRADEIALFHTLTAIRRGFRKTPANILNAGKTTPLLEVATHSGFRYLADVPPRELVVGARINPGTFATMNFSRHARRTRRLERVDGESRATSWDEIRSRPSRDAHQLDESSRVARVHESTGESFIRAATSFAACLGFFSLIALPLIATIRRTSG